MKLSVLLFGATGQLGALIKSNAPDYISLTCLSSADLDISNKKDVSAVIKQHQPDVIINAAAYTQVDKAEKEIDSAFAVNAQGPENLALAVSAQTRIIHISTDFVFDGMQASPYQPEDKTNPLSVYGKSKLAGEHKLLNILPDQTCIIRTAWLYSAEGQNFVNTMLNLMRSKDTLSVVSDQIGTPTSAHKLAKVVWRFVEQEEAKGVFHWTDRGEASWYEFACAIQEEAIELGILKQAIKIMPITAQEYPLPAKRPAYSVLGKERTYDLLGLEGNAWRQELKEALQQKT